MQCGANIRLGCLPLDNLRMSFFVSPTALLKDAVVPSRGLDDFWSSDQIFPERFHGSELLSYVHDF